MATTAPTPIRPTELAQILHTKRLTQADAGRLLGVGERAVRRYLSGDRLLCRERALRCLCGAAS